LRYNTTGDNNIAFGLSAGRFIADGSTSNAITNNSIFIGRNTRALGDNQTNQIVIGNLAIGLGSNTVVLGDTNITTTALRGNVGIGTTSPDYPLAILRTQNADTFIQVINAGTGSSSRSGIAIGEVFGSYSGVLSYVNASANFGTGAELFAPNSLNLSTNAAATGGITINPYSGPIIFGTNGFATANERMRITSTGNVGIGTTAPSENLHVSGNILIGNYGASNSQLRFANITNAGNSAYIGQTAAGFEINAGSTGVFRLQIPPGTDTTALTLYGNGVNTAQFFRNQRIRFGGNLTTNPSSTLEIIGAGADSSTTAFLIQNSAPASILTVRDDGSTYHDIDASNGEFIVRRRTAPSSRYFRIQPDGTFHGYTFSGEGAGVGNSNDGAYSFNGQHRRAGSGGTVSVIKFNNIWLQEQFNLTEFNVLHIAPTLNSSGTTTNAIARGIYYNPILTSLTGTTHRAIETTSGDILFQSGSSPLFFVSQSGNVGIGISTPSARFQVRGTGDSSIWITSEDFNAGTNTGTVVRLGTTNSTGNSAGMIDVLNSGISSYGNLTLARLGGNVGIGTTSPSAKLQVQGAGATSSTTALRIENSNASSSMVVLDDGFVGIGTTTPITTLDVENSLNTSITSLSSVPVAASAIFGNIGNSVILTAGVTNTQISYLQARQKTGTGTAFDIALNPLGGNVGIGTTSPNARLDVSGSTIISGSLTVTEGITGSFFGTASYATNANNASFIDGYDITNFVLTSGNQSISGSLNVSGSGRFGNGLTVTGSLTVNGPLTINNQTGGTPTEGGSSAGVVNDYWGTEDGKFLSTPATWLAVILDGNTYFIPAYL